MSKKYRLSASLVFIVVVGIVLLKNIPAESSNYSPKDLISICQKGCNYTSIQAAINNPNTLPGSILVIKDQIHTEAAIEVGKNVTITGSVGENTIIQAHKAPAKADERVIFIKQGVTATLKNVIIRHGFPKKYPGSGGGIGNLGSLKLINVQILENDASTSGGGIWNKGKLSILNSIITKNRAHRSGPLGEACGAGGGIQNEKGGQLIIEGSKITHNSSDSRGGGLFISCDTTAVVKDSVISHNRSRREGGGIALMGELDISNSRIHDNLVGGLANFGKLTFSDSLLENNKVASDCGNYCKNGKCGSIVKNSNNRIGRSNL